MRRVAEVCSTILGYVCRVCSPARANEAARSANESKLLARSASLCIPPQHQSPVSSPPQPGQQPGSNIRTDELSAYIGTDFDYITAESTLIATNYGKRRTRRYLRPSSIYICMVSQRLQRQPGAPQLHMYVRRRSDSACQTPHVRRRMWRVGAG